MARTPRVPFYPYNVKNPRERAVLPSERAVPWTARQLAGPPASACHYLCLLADDAAYLTRDVICQAVMPFYPYDVIIPVLNILTYERLYFQLFMHLLFYAYETISFQ